MLRLIRSVRLESNRIIGLLIRSVLVLFLNLLKRGLVFDLFSIFNLKLDDLLHLQLFLLQFLNHYLLDLSLERSHPPILGLHLADLALKPLYLFSKLTLHLFRLLLQLSPDLFIVLRVFLNMFLQILYLLVLKFIFSLLLLVYFLD